MTREWPAMAPGSDAAASPVPASHAGTSPVRASIGVIRMLVGLLVLAAIVTQITDQLVNDAFAAEEYFSYFTIQTSMMHVVVLVTGGLFAMRHPFDTDLLTGVRLCMVTYATVTGTVYAVLLRGVPQEGFIGIAWPNEVIHVIIPVFIALDWVLAPGRRPLPWRRLWMAVSYPLVWVAFTLVRGLITGWFPYPFLQPGGPGGWASVFGYVVGIAAFVVAVASVAIGVSQVFRSRATR